MRSQLEALIGERLNDIVCPLGGIAMAELTAPRSPASAGGLPASSILVVQSSRYLMVVLCLPSMTGVWSTMVEPWLVIQG